jgi:eukaryotic-like serine/threonine-protein kinase
VELVVPVVRALVCAHEHAIVHRNLTPDNIFVTGSGTVKVLNFGTATLWETEVSSEPSQDSPSEDVREPSPASSPPGRGPGTLAYRSPEQWMGVGVDHHSDIWAVGVILYEMLAGKRPLDPLSGYQLMVTAMLDQPMPSVRGDCPDLPDALVAIIDQCLVKQKARRVPSARQLLDALEPLLARRPAR